MWKIKQLEECVKILLTIIIVIRIVAKFGSV